MSDAMIRPAKSSFLGASKSPMRRDGALTNNERTTTANERMKVSTETLRKPTRPAKPDQQPEASLGWRPKWRLQA
jgi:hypothetical protein